MSDSEYTPNPPAPVVKSTKYYVYKSVTKKNGVITFTTLHDGTCTAKSYYQIDQLNGSSEVTYVSYLTCDSYQILKGPYTSGNATMILNFAIYHASINGNELTVTKFNTVMNDTYEESTIAKIKE